MGKSKKKDSSASAAVPKCTCDHPFNCDCGNRPPRPSKGHKWYADTQEWAGKGHKQKGASGQTASVDKGKAVTAVGKTSIAAWQRLPSQLLQDFSQRQKRPKPKYKNVSKADKTFQYRCIVPDAKNSEKDLFFVPAAGVLNEEQAKEEAALLGLLHLTPEIPHERKLPEPYKTTWLNAIQQQKQQANNKKKTTVVDSKAGGASDSKLTAAKEAPGAQASTSLLAATRHFSKADQRREQDVKRQARLARIRQHEAVRMANQNHPVFLSAGLRKQIAALLRGDFQWEDEEKDQEHVGEDEADEADDARAYVLHRLRAQGLTLAQSKKALAECHRPSCPENEWEDLYEECLQWLLVHLEEEQLPEGLDPRGRTLDVIVAPANTSSSSEKDSEENLDSVMSLVADYGLSVQEARMVQKRAETDQIGFLDALYASVVAAAGLSVPLGSDTSVDDNRLQLQEEIEALEAIFGSDCQVTTESNGVQLVAVKLLDGEMALQVLVDEGAYPAQPPRRVLVSGTWPKKQLGATVHIEVVKYLESIPLGEPVLFELHGHVQALLQDWESLQLASILPRMEEKETDKAPASAIAAEEAGKNVESHHGEKRAQNLPRARRYARERAPFWSLPPSKTPAATAFPDIPVSLRRSRASLPAAAARNDFLASLQLAETGGRVLLVTGDTGCGKTTQIPQFLLEESPKGVKIVVAQPRRLAATGVAARVATERGEALPGQGSVGYVVRGDSAMCKNSRLVFCTTGVLLRQLQNDGALECLTHIVVDEVHERHLDTDVLLGLLKQSLADHPNLRVVLMSATLDADRFAAYWGADTPRIHIPGRTFPVEDFLLEDVLSLTGYVPSKNRKGKGRPFTSYSDPKPRRTSPWDDSEKSDNEEDPAEEESGNQPGTSGNAIRDHGIPIEDLVKRVDETSVDYELVGRLVSHLVSNKDVSDDGSILVFLSGAPEISAAKEAIGRCTRGLSVSLLPLHGGLQPREQNLVFRSAERGFTKVILSTNVAETSVTIPDCTIVIDSCREKQSSYDPVNRMPLLLEQFASRASLKQRRGRAGRVREGTCYKLISRSTYDKLKEHGEPEIRRCALDQTLLSLLFLGVESGAGSFMRTLLDPPSSEALVAASVSLRRLGAVEDGIKPGELRLTPMGVHLAGIPAPPTVGKLLVMGSILGCRDAALAMAAGMSAGRSPFLRIDAPRRRRDADIDERTAIEDMKKENVLKERSALFTTVGNSDHALLAAVFLKWNDCGGGARKRYCESLGLSFNGMRDIADLVRQLDSSLRSAGFASSQESNRHSGSWRIVRTCCVSALAPSQLVKVVRPATKYHETAEGAKELDGEARGLKFFIRTDSSAAREERVFIHPSSANFATGSFSCPWLVYHSLVRTSKAFLRDVTESSSYGLLLFGGGLEVQASKDIIVVDGWANLSANARIGSLVGGLRKKMDELLLKKVAEPSFELSSTHEMKLITKLLLTDGLGS